MLWSDVTGYGTAFPSTVPLLPVQSIQATHSYRPVLMDVVATVPVLIPYPHHVLLSAVFSSLPSRLVLVVMRPLHTSDNPGSCWFDSIVSYSCTHAAQKRTRFSRPARTIASTSTQHPALVMIIPSIQSLSLPTLASLHPSIHPSYQCRRPFRTRGRNAPGPVWPPTTASWTVSERRAA